MMNIEIKNRYTGSIILCGEYESIKDCCERNRGANLGEQIFGEHILREQILREHILGEQYL